MKFHNTNMRSIPRLRSTMHFVLKWFLHSIGILNKVKSRILSEISKMYDFKFFTIHNSKFIIHNLKLIRILSYMSLVFVLLPAGVNAQDKDVTVVKEYTPTISDAFKVNIEPSILDTVSVKPTNFKYYFVNKPVFVPFAIQPIQAAKMVGEPLSLLHNNYVRVGFGSNVMPLFEYYYNSLRSKEFQYGIYAKHLSFNNKIKLANDKKIPASFSDNEIKIFGKRMLHFNTIGGELSFARNGFHYYGINPDLDSIPDKDTLFQRFIKFNMNTYIKSTYMDESHINYFAKLNYGFFEERYGNYENQISLDGKAEGKFNGETVGIDFTGAYINQNTTADTANEVLLKLMPFVSKIEKVWRIQAGLKVVADAEGDSLLWHFFPTVKMQYNIIENIMIPYIGFDGNLNPYHFSTIHEENYFVKPNLLIKNENHKMILFGGMKGALTKTMFYDFGASYGLIDNMHFFVNDTLELLQNHFDVVYDNVQLFSLHGEITWKKTHKWNILLRADYNKYTMDKEEKPWQKPELTVALSSKYNLKDKILIDIDLFYLDKVYAKTFNSGTMEPLLITPTYDINIGFEYRYSKFLSGFITGKNILGKYDMWNYYPTMGFHVMLGITYAF